MRSSVSARPQADTSSSKCFDWDIDRPANNQNNQHFFAFSLCVAAAGEIEYASNLRIQHTHLKDPQAVLRTMTDRSSLYWFSQGLIYLYCGQFKRNNYLKPQMKTEELLASEGVKLRVCSRSLRFHHQTHRHTGLMFIQRGYPAGSDVSLW